MAELFDCIKNFGSLNEIKQLLDSNQDVNYRNDNKTTLHMFCESYAGNAGAESLNILNLLLEKGPEVDAVDNDNKTPLMYLVCSGFPVDHLGLLLGKGADVNKTDTNGWSVLHYVGHMEEIKIGENSINILKLLIKKGAIVDSVNNDFRETPLMWLVRKNFPLDHIEILLKNGANINYKDKVGNTVLHLLAFEYCSKIVEESLKKLKSFVRYGCEVDAVNDDGDTPLKVLFEKKLAVDHLQVLLRKSSNLNCKLTNGDTYLHHFVRSYSGKFDKNSLEILKVLIRYGGDVDCANDNGDTPIKLLIEAKCPAEHLRVALCKKTEVDRKYFGGCTIFHHFAEAYSGAADDESLSALKVLLESGASVNVANDDGVTPLMLFLKKGFPIEHIKMAVHKSKGINHEDKSGSTLMHHFIASSSDSGERTLKILSLLLESGASVDIANSKGDTPLMQLLKQRFPVDHLELAIAKAENINYKDNLGNTLVHNFIDTFLFNMGDDSLKWLCLLLESGASVDILNVQGETPLVLLLKKQYPVSHLELAVRSSKDIDYKYEFGNTLMHLSIESCLLDAGDDGLKLLSSFLESGASVDIPNEIGETPLRLIFEERYPVTHLRMALKASQDVNHKDKDDNNMLHDFVRLYTLEMDEVSLSVLKSLVEFGANVDAPNKNGETPLRLLLKEMFPADHLEVAITASDNIHLDDAVLHYFVDCYQSKIDEESLKVLKLLLLNGANVHALNENGETLLMALLKNRFPVDHVKVVLDKGVDIRGPFGNYPGVLHYLLRGGRSLHSGNLFELMLDYGANPNESDGEGTPVLFSCLRANKEVYVRELFEHGAEFDWDSRFGREIVSNYLKYGNRKDDIYEKIFKYALLRNDSAFDKFLDSPVGDVSKLRRFVNASVKELAQMRVRVMTERETFYDFVFETNRRTLGEYFSVWVVDVGAGALAELRDEALVEEFPIYATLIRTKLEIARRWAELQKTLKAVCTMSVVSVSGNEVELNHYCVQNIAAFLDDYHLKKFISASVADPVEVQ